MTRCAGAGWGGGRVVAQTPFPGGGASPHGRRTSQTTGRTRHSKKERSMDQRPEVIVCDVNETLSDTTALGQNFADVGVAAHLAATWFAQVLRDGFALTSTGDNVTFATIAGSLLDAPLASAELNLSVAEAKKS